MNRTQRISIGVFASLAIVGVVGAMQEANAPAPVVRQVDHIIYAAPDLDAAVDDLEQRLGVRAVYGGEHPGRGTRNALLSLGESVYLEIIAPDPAQDVESQMGVGGLDAARLIGWAARSDDLEEVVRMAEAAGVGMSEITPGSRARPDGVTLRWRTTAPRDVDGGEVVPFFIDWGESEHPSATSPGGLRLVGLRAEHPEPERIRAVLDAMGLELEVTEGPAPALIATIERADGAHIELR